MVRVCMPMQAVHTIHKARIVHSDLKAANILAGDGHLKLIDFGIDKVRRAKCTE